MQVLNLLSFLGIDEDVKGVKHFSVICFFKSIEFIVIGSALADQLRLLKATEAAFDDPLTVDEAAVAQIIVAALAAGAGHLVEFAL